MNVCLVWEQIPESTVVYVFDNLTNEEIATMREAHLHYINSGEENDAANWVSEFLQDKDQYIVEHAAEGPIDLVVVCGFLL